MKMLRAHDIMNAEVIKVRDDMTVRELASFLVDNEISGAPVENREGKLVGVVSLTDIALTVSGGDAVALDRSNPSFFVRGWEEALDVEAMTGFHVEEGEGLLVREIMTPSIYSVPEDTPVAEVARTMLDAHLHRLLVTRGDRLAGIITTSDLLQLIAAQR